jgi:hypothetical protein
MTGELWKIEAEDGVLKVVGMGAVEAQGEEGEQPQRLERKISRTIATEGRAKQVARERNGWSMLAWNRQQKMMDLPTIWPLRCP